jgi:peroxiredoxin Q/BCP
VLVTGDTAPLFELSDQDGITRRLADYRGRFVLVYFYPKDMTPGCTIESCAIEHDMPSFKEGGIQVFGISADTVKSHKRFAGHYQLSFPLLADTEKKTIEEYGVWGEKKMMGRTYMGIRRMSFLIDPDGVIKKVYEKVVPSDHAKEVLKDVAEFSTSS